MEPGAVDEPTAAAPYQPFTRLIQYDAASRVTDVFAGDQANARFIRDNAGRVVGRYKGNGNEHVSSFFAGDWVQWDALGRISRTQSLLGFGLGAYVNEEFNHDVIGRIHREKYSYLFMSTPVSVDGAYDPHMPGDPVRRMLHYNAGGVDDLWVESVPDAIGRLAALSWRSDGMASATPLVSYSHEGNLTRRRVTSYPLGSASPGTFTTTYSYDEYGRMAGIHHVFGAGTPVSYGFRYDASSNLTKEIYEKQGLAAVTGEGDRFSYDEHNRLLEAWMGSDASALAAADPDTTGTYVSKLTYGLDAANNRSNITTTPYGGGGTTEPYELQQSVGGQGPSNRYEAVGPIKLWYDDRGNLIFDGFHYYVYDIFNRLIEVFAVASSSQQLQDGASSSSSLAASMGAAAGLTSAEAGQGGEPYVVEDITALRHARSMIMSRVNGNLLSVLASNQQSPLASQLSEPLGSTVVQATTSSGSGLPSSGVQSSASYGGMAPSAASLNLVLEALYLYDYSDRRVLRWLMVEAGPRYYAYDGWEEVEELQLGLGPIKQFVWGEELDELVAFRVRDGSAWDAFYVAEGGAHCPVRVVDAGGSSVEVQEYDPFGATLFYRASGAYLGKDSHVGNPFAWKALRVDPETQLVYVRHRAYSPAMGRFVSQDPLGSWLDPVSYGNPYVYAGNEPLASHDPLGLQTMHGLPSHNDPKWMKDARAAWLEEYYEIQAREKEEARKRFEEKVDFWASIGGALGDALDEAAARRGGRARSRAVTTNQARHGRRAVKAGGAQSTNEPNNTEGASRAVGESCASKAGNAIREYYERLEHRRRALS